MVAMLKRAIKHVEDEIYKDLEYEHNKKVIKLQQEAILNVVTTYKKEWDEKKKNSLYK